MVDFTLSAEDRQIRATARAFIEKEVMPFEPVLLERGRQTPGSPGLTREERRALQEKGRSMGLWGIDTPEDLGGADLSAVSQALIFEELGRTLVDFEFGGSALPTLYACEGWQRDSYLIPCINGERQLCTAISEPGSGSDARAMRTTAVRRDGQWVLNGEKVWITHGDYADFAIVFARTPEEGDPDGITCFLVDRDMGWTSSSIPMMGSRDKVASLHFDDVKVPERNVLGTVNHGFAHAMGFIYRNRAYVISAKNIGTGRRLLEMAIDWSKNRMVFGKPLADRENIAFAIAESEIELRAAALFVYHSAARADGGQDYRHEAYVSKVHCARMANSVVDRVLQIHGAMGYAAESAIERWYRDLRVERIYDGSDEVNLAGIARNLFRGHVQPGAIFS
jgi:alkylation response protein AidB-like acyl-CoA dehydrogenase